MPRPRQTRRSADSRTRILAAAAAEFSARGYAGAGIDRIARRARLNKAMIYYHFASKRALYREILRDVYSAVGERLRVIVAGHESPEDKLGAFLVTIIEQAERRPFFPAIVLREIAEGAPRLDSEILRLIGSLFALVRQILDEGRRAKVFVDVHPVVAYLGMVAPTVFYLASAPVRRAMQRVNVTELGELEPREFVAQLERFALKSLREGDSRVSA